MRLAVVASRYRSLRQAADALNVRQSTLSRSLRELENRVGATLFQRTNGGTYLTPLGQEFIASVTQILEEADEVVRRIRRRSSGQWGGISIGIHASPSVGNFRAALNDYRGHFPDVTLQVVDGSSERLISDLKSCAIDIAFIVGDGFGWADKALPVWSERVVIAVPESHPFYRQVRFCGTIFCMRNCLCHSAAQAPS